MARLATSVQQVMNILKNKKTKALKNAPTKVGAFFFANLKLLTSIKLVV